MRDPTIARNYAEALLELARRADDLEGWGRMMDELANAFRSDRSLRVFLDSPRVSGAEKIRVIGKAFEDSMPRPMVRFLQMLIKNRRQMLIPHVAEQYHDLVDQAVGRVHASVTLAHEPDEAQRSLITQRLAAAVGREVVAHYQVDERIIGGMIARIGDTVLDGSARKRLATLRTRMIGLPRASG